MDGCMNAQTNATSLTLTFDLQERSSQRAPQKEKGDHCIPFPFLTMFSLLSQNKSHLL